eukprot:m.53575 g.53575  ORF g.53575 m.53575 type:complete len:353 (-) comp13569_c1_seq12:165-1223(-)
MFEFMMPLATYIFDKLFDKKSAPEVVHETPPEVTSQLNALKDQVASLSQLVDKSAEQQEQLEAVQAKVAQMEQDKQEQADAVEQLKSELSDVQVERTRIQEELAAKAEAEKDPAKMREIKDQLFTNFVDGIAARGLGKDMYKLIRSSLEAKVCFIGRVSSGKSTVINALLNEIRAVTGVGTTTRYVSQIGKSDPDGDGVRLSYWDVPGHDDKFSYIDMQVIGTFASMHAIVILYNNAVSDVQDMIRTAWALSKPIVLVRTMLDNTENQDDDDDEKPWQEVLADDRAYAASIGFRDIPIFGISARNVLRASKEAQNALEGSIPVQYPQYQWRELHEHLTSVGSRLYVKATQEA